MQNFSSNKSQTEYFLWKIYKSRGKICSGKCNVKRPVNPEIVKKSMPII